MKKRCAWVPLSKPDYVAYHDQEWGRKVTDDRLLFEMLILEGAQAGLSWYTVLQKREMYRKVFKGFDPSKVARMTDTELAKALTNPGIIRNRLKVYGTRQNARVFLAIQKEFSSFHTYLRSILGKKVIHRAKTMRDIPTTTPEAETLSKDLQKRGMTFVGGSIIYAYMQAVGLVDDHMRDCYRAQQ